MLAMVIKESRLRMMSGNNPVKSAYTLVAERKCYNCGEEGHLSYNCPLPKSYGGRSRTRGGHGDQGGHGGRGGGCVEVCGRGHGGPQANVATSESGSHVTIATIGGYSICHIDRGASQAVRTMAEDERTREF